MRFFASKKQIFFDEFKSLLPAEASVLEGCLELEADFELDQDKKLYLLSETTGPLSLNISKMTDYHRQFFFKNSVYDQPLAKALGVKRGKPKPLVLDATAGTLKDTCLLLSMGLKVRACERHPVAQALIINALNKTRPDGLEFYPCDVNTFIGDEHSQEVGAIYFDPMYESPSKKSAPRKEMRIFREVIQSDQDARATATALLETGKRLVIKRPTKSPYLLGEPDISFGKKSTHYDVYLEKLQ